MTELIVSIAVCIICIVFAFFIGVVSGLEKGHKSGFSKGYDLCKRLDATTIAGLRKENARLLDKVIGDGKL